MCVREEELICDWIASFQEKTCSQLFMQQICVSLSVGDTVSKLKWGWKLQNFTRYSDVNVKIFLMGV